MLLSEAIGRANIVFRRQMLGLSEYRRPARGGTPKPMATEKNETRTPASAPPSGGALADLRRVQALRGISPTALTSPSKYAQTYGDLAKLSGCHPIRSRPGRTSIADAPWMRRRGPTRATKPGHRSRITAACPHVTLVSPVCVLNFDKIRLGGVAGAPNWESSGSASRSLRQA